MEEIAVAAGTSKSIIYRYFEDRSGLQVAVGSAVMAQMHDALARAAATAASPQLAVRAMVAAYLETIENSPNVYYFVTRTAAVAGTEDGHGEQGAATAAEPPLTALVDSVIELIAEPFARVAHVPWAQAAAWAAGVVGFVRGAGEWWLERRDDPRCPDRWVLTEQVTTWLCQGPVGVLASAGPVTADQPPSASTEAVR